MSIRGLSSQEGDEGVGRVGTWGWVLGREKSQCKRPGGQGKHTCRVSGPARSPLWLDRESIVGHSAGAVSI